MYRLRRKLKNWEKAIQSVVTGNGSDCKTGCVRGSKCPGLSAGSTRCGGVCRSRLLAWEDPGRERSSRQSVHADPSAAPLKEPRGGEAWERPSLACPARWMPWVRSRVWSGTGSAACSAVGRHLFPVSGCGLGALLLPPEALCSCRKHVTVRWEGPLENA